MAGHVLLVLEGHIKVCEQEGGHADPCVEVIPTLPEATCTVLDRELQNLLGSNAPSEKRYRITIEEIV